MMSIRRYPDSDPQHCYLCGYYRYYRVEILVLAAPEKDREWLKCITI
jgi:hypothetical protein